MIGHECAEAARRCQAMKNALRRIIARLFGPRIVEPEIRMACAKIGISMDRYGRCWVPSDEERGITRDF